jgi:hypothetical protein
MIKIATFLGPLLAKEVFELLVNSAQKKMQFNININFAPKNTAKAKDQDANDFDTIGEIKPAQEDPNDALLSAYASFNNWK